MDEYTKKTKYWLDARFKQVDRDGIYYAHQRPSMVLERVIVN